MSGILERLGDQMDDIVNGAEIAALQRAEGEMKARIHQRGESSNDVPLVTRAKRKRGRYQFDYSFKREFAGRRIDRKDLEFTGGLRRGYGLGTSQGKNVIGFFFDRARLVASGQEQQTGQEIFSLSETEHENMMEIYLNRINRGLRNTVGK